MERREGPKEGGVSPLRWLLAHFEEAACAGLLLLMALLAFVNILVRYLTDYSFAFSEELEVSALVYLTLFGAAAAFRRGLHLGLSFFLNRFGPRGRRAFLLLSVGLTLAVFAVLTYYALLQIRDEMELRTLSEALEVPQWLYTLAIPLGAVLIAVRLLQHAAETWRRLGRPAS